MKRLLVVIIMVFTITAGLGGQCFEAAQRYESTADSDRIAVGRIAQDLVATGYSGNEKLSYDVSWTGGIKIGELHLEVNRVSSGEDIFEIRAFITTENGAVHLIYPIRDLHVTKVRGPDKLPFYYEVWQQEGYNYRAHRILEYDQKRGHIRYMKNGKLEGNFDVEGKINNEFSSFFNSRLMDLTLGDRFIVPTFADKRRVEVVVHTVSRSHIEDTVLGPLDAMAVMPVLTFEGLYEKKGDTVIWYSDDECRVPVKITSKIVIGSLTAELSAYDNPACTRYATVALKD